MNRFHAFIILLVLYVITFTYKFYGYETGLKNTKFKAGQCVYMDVSNEFEQKYIRKYIVSVGKESYQYSYIHEDGTISIDYKYVEKFSYIDDDYKPLDCKIKGN